MSILCLAYCDRKTFCYRELRSRDTDYSPRLLKVVELVELFPLSLRICIKGLVNVCTGRLSILPLGVKPRQ